MERWLSGRKRHRAKVLGAQVSQGFESLPLRNTFFIFSQIIKKVQANEFCGSFYLKFEPFSWKILIIEVEESGVAPRRYFSVGLRLRSARRVVRACAAGGVWGGMPRQSACFFGRVWGGNFSTA